MGGNRENYSNFGFFDAIAMPTALGVVAETVGRIIDLQGYDNVTLVVHAGLQSTGSAGTSDFRLILQHAYSNAAGVLTWSLVPGSLLIHSVMGGYDSTTSNGLFDYITQSYCNASDNKIGIVGYKKTVTYRWIRLIASITGTPSITPIQGTWILGNPNNWAVNEAVNLA
jgi:hypothetical protein